MPMSLEVLVSARTVKYLSAHDQYLQPVFPSHNNTS
jgi:hypothetical protein